MKTSFTIQKCCSFLGLILVGNNAKALTRAMTSLETIKVTEPSLLMTGGGGLEISPMLIKFCATGGFQKC